MHCADKTRLSRQRKELRDLSNLRYFANRQVGNALARRGRRKRECPDDAASTFSLVRVTSLSGPAAPLAHATRAPVASHHPARAAALRRINAADRAKLVRPILHVAVGRRRQQWRGNRDANVADRAIDRVAPTLDDGIAQRSAIQCRRTTPERPARLSLTQRGTVPIYRLLPSPEPDVTASAQGVPGAGDRHWFGAGHPRSANSTWHSLPLFRTISTPADQSKRAVWKVGRTVGLVR